VEAEAMRQGRKTGSSEGAMQLRCAKGRTISWCGDGNGMEISVGRRREDPVLPSSEAQTSKETEATNWGEELLLPRPVVDGRRLRWLSVQSVSVVTDIGIGRATYVLSSRW
jgi:hypothetical protein